MPYFVSGTFYEALQATANVCISIAKQEHEAQMEAFQRVVTPMKSWIQEDYPRLMKVVQNLEINVQVSRAPLWLKKENFQIETFGIIHLTININGPNQIWNYYSNKL